MSAADHRLDVLASVFSTSLGFARANLEGMDPDHLRRPAVAGGSTAGWALGHIVYWRSQAVAMLGGDPVWDADAHPELRGVKKGDLPADVEPDLSELRGALDGVSARLTTALEGAPEVDEELLGTLTFFATHDAYHTGQLAIFRRMAGLPGAIGQ